MHLFFVQFSKEIESTREIFERDNLAPPTTRNQPPVAGSINWARSLFGRVRKTKHKFETTGSDMMQDAPALEVAKFFNKFIFISSCYFLREKLLLCQRWVCFSPKHTPLADLEIFVVFLGGLTNS